MIATSDGCSDDTYSGRLPEPSPRYGDVKQENAWRLITSGDASCVNYTLHDFLRSNESFFFRLDQENFVFINDKKTVSRYYIPSGKDQEYDGVGSIVGMTINIKELLRFILYSEGQQRRGNPLFIIGMQQLFIR